MPAPSSALASPGDWPSYLVPGCRASSAPPAVVPSPKGKARAWSLSSLPWASWRPSAYSDLSFSCLFCPSRCDASGALGPANGSVVGFKTLNLSIPHWSLRRAEAPPHVGPELTARMEGSETTGELNCSVIEFGSCLKSRTETTLTRSSFNM